MKHRIGRNVKKIVAGLLAGAMVLTGVYCLPVNSRKAYAANETVIHTEQLEMSKYVNGTNRIAPKPKDPGYEEWVFAGWYSDVSCGKDSVITDTIPEGRSYAKFVPAGLLSVKCQTLASTTADSRENSQLRLVSTVDNLQYKNVGFDIRMGEKEFHYESEKVCREIHATDKSKVEFNYTPQDFHNMAKYFTTVTIINITYGEFTTGVFINPFWTTLDGTKVYGVSRYARVEDRYLNIVNVPVRLYTDEHVAAGYLEVGYDAKKFEYVDFDAGTVLEEMEAADTGSTVRCVGNVAAITGNAAADGLYVNLRFRLKDGVSLKEDEVFQVSNEQFCDNKEAFVTFPFRISDVVYREITSAETP